MLQAPDMGYLTPFISYFGLPMPHKDSGIVMMVLCLPLTLKKLRVGVNLCCIPLFLHVQSRSKIDRSEAPGQNFKTKLSLIASFACPLMCFNRHQYFIFSSEIILLKTLVFASRHYFWHTKCTVEERLYCMLLYLGVNKGR